MTLDWLIFFCLNVIIFWKVAIRSVEQVLFSWESKNLPSIVWISNVIFYLRLETWWNECNQVDKKTSTWTEWESFQRNTHVSNRRDINVHVMHGPHTKQFSTLVHPSYNDTLSANSSSPNAAWQPPERYNFNNNRDFRLRRLIASNDHPLFRIFEHFPDNSNSFISTRRTSGSSLFIIFFTQCWRKFDLSFARNKFWKRIEKENDRFFDMLRE